MTARTNRRSPLAVALLVLLAEEPMHAYRMQQLIKERHKDQVVNVSQRNSVYQTLDRLRRAGLITVRDTERAENRPERTVYQLTEDGSSTLRQWMHEMLSTPAREYPEFPVALASLPIIGQDEALRALRLRETTLRERVAEQQAALDVDQAVLPRLFQLETEYEHAITRAELRWVQAVIEDLRTGKLRWGAEWLREVGASLTANNP